MTEVDHETATRPPGGGPAAEVPRAAEATNVCPNQACKRWFRTPAGLTLHRRKCQPDTLAAERLSQQPRRRNWTLEEKALVQAKAYELRAADGSLPCTALARLLIERGDSDRPIESLKRLIMAFDRDGLLAPDQTTPLETREILNELAERPLVADPPEAIGTQSDATMPTDTQGHTALDDREVDLESPVAAWRRRSLETLVTWQGEEKSVLPPGDLAALSEDAITVAFEDWLKGQGWSPPATPPRRKKLTNQVSKPLSKRKARAAMVEKTRRWFDKQPHRTVKAIVKGTFGLTDPKPATETVEFWAESLSTPVEVDEVHLEPMAPANYALCNLIQRCEVVAAAKTLRAKTAPGLDGLTATKVKTLPAGQLAQWFSLFLFRGFVPRRLNDARVTLIPKVAEPAGPSDYRPIAVSSVLLRLFHKILDSRLQAIPLNNDQKGFKQCDGTRDHSFLLRSLLKHVRAEKESLMVCFIDVKNAFGAISHQAVIEAARAKGVPPPMLTYLQNLYANSFLDFGDGRACVKLGAGVRQGDPISGSLFNFAVDCVRQGLDPAVGFRVGTSNVQSLLFADDSVLFASTKPGLQVQIDRFADGLKRLGMSLNAKKCATLCIHRTSLNRSAAVHVDPLPCLGFGGEKFPALSSSDTYRYLGVKVGFGGTDTSFWSEELKTRLDRLNKSSLRPQEKMFGLREVVIPGMIHSLVLSEATKGLLRRLDTQIREAVRSWLHLPRDTPLGFLHARAVDGGLGVPSLTARIPRLRSERLIKLNRPGYSEVMTAVLETPTGSKLLDTATKLHGWPEKTRRRQEKQLICGKASEFEAAKQLLWNSVDGSGLKEIGSFGSGAGGKNESRWVTDPVRYRTSGGEFVRAILVRGGLLKTGERATRGVGREGQRTCRRCRQVQSLGHIINNCPMTHGLRVARHDRFVKCLKNALENRGWKVQIEPRVKLAKGSFVKPDIVAAKGDEVVVLDPSIVGAKVSVDRAQLAKKNLYDRAEVKEHSFDFARSCGFKPKSFDVAGVIISFRGVWSLISWTLLRRLGLPVRLLNFWVIRLLNDAYYTWASEVLHRAG
jgi:Reverse transcriptase (RNA-dependent DNA polymerase)